MDKNTSADKNTNKGANNCTEKNAQSNMNRTEFAEEYSVDTNKKANCNKESKTNKSN